MTDQELLVSGIEALNLSIDKQKVEKFIDYKKLLVSWSKKMNITSLTSSQDIIIKHFIDSVSSAAYISYSDKKIIDIGSGGGFPGLPLKIVFPEIQITFVDSSSKKARALKSICEELKMDNYQVINDNIENVARVQTHRESYDIAVSRAVSPLNTLLEYMIPMLRVKGKAVIYKGPDVEKEVENSHNALRVLKSKIKKNVYFRLPFTNEGRRILVVEKEGKTEPEYPRGIGKPRKRPL